MEEWKKSLLIPMQEEKKINKNEMAKAQTLNGEWGNSVQYMLMLGNQLINYIPLEPITELSENYSDEAHFKNALYDFYTYCESGEIIYTEIKFIKFFNLHNFKIPASVINFLDYKNSAPTYEYGNKQNIIPLMDVRNIEPEKVVSYVNNDEITICSTYAIENSNEYYIVIAYELLKHGYRIKRCIECGKWFIVINKIDTFYCPECKAERHNLLNQIWYLRKKIKDDCKGFPESSTNWNISIKIDNIQPNTNTASKKELQEYLEKLIEILKNNFPKSYKTYINKARKNIKV